MKALDTSDVDAILPFVPEEGEAAQRVHVPADDCLEAVDDLVCHHYSVGGLMGLARMPALALDSHLKRSEAPVIAPLRTPTLPMGNSGHTCCAKITSGGAL